MIKYAVSNIAWPAEQDEEVANALKNSVISGIEIAPSRYFSDVEKATKEDFQALKSHWASLGFSITSLQSLLFNRSDLQLFASDSSRSRLKRFLLSLGKKSALLGAGPMVFGSPKNRNRGDLSIDEAGIIARDFFSDLFLEWPESSSFITIEANPEIYDCNFLTKSSQALEFVQLVGSPKFRWHLDLACTELANESAVDLINKASALPAHVHLSEINLSPLSDSNTVLYRDFLVALSDRGYEGVVTLEMRQTSDVRDLFQSVEILNRVSV